MSGNRRLSFAAGGLAVAAAAVFGVPALGDFWTFVATLAVVYALLGLSLVVLTGWTGQLNLHVAALGLGWGAYASFALISTGAPPMVALLGAAFLTIPFSLVVGLFAVRFRGLELAVATLAIGLTFEQLVFRNLGSWLARGNKLATPFESSFVPMPRPQAFASDRAFYLLALALGAIVYLALRNVARGRTGRELVAIREREVAAEVHGLPALRYRIGAFVASSAIAGLAGALFASLKLGIAPDSFDLDLSFLVLAAVVIGGIRTLEGGVLGGILAAVLPEVVRFGPLRLISGERLLFVFAVGLALTLAFRPQGLVSPRRKPIAHPPGTKRVPVAVAAPRNGAPRNLRPAAVRADGLSVHFGGVQALDGVDIAVPRGEICALIGPNGAGKTTLFNCLSGIVTPDAGRVYVDAEDVTDMPPHRRANRGLGRTFQSIELFSELSVIENVMATSSASDRASSAADALAAVGLESRADATPDELSHAEHQLLQLAMVIVREPKVVLLDEPTAGLDPKESAELARLVVELRDAHNLTVLLVEHDMTVVGDIAEWVYVLDFGHVIAQGTPSGVRRDTNVIDRYLGTRKPERARARRS
jgi:branched-chain amino acid transport system permease protein